MFYYIKGTLAHLGNDFAAVDCGGVCYKTWISGTTYSAVASKLGGAVKLFTHLVVREDVFELYGFATEEELELFRLLIGVSGVGPKAACAVLTGLDPSGVAAAVNAGDAKAISRAQGIGLKTAQKIILELGGKIAKLGIEGGDGAVQQGASSAVDADAVATLMGIGYRRDEATAALKGLPADLSLEEKIGEALKRLSRI